MTLELREDQWGMVSQKIGKKILMLLGGDVEEVIGIGAEGNMVEFLLKPDTDISHMKLGGVNILVEEGITIKRARAVGMRRVMLHLKGVPFSVSDREVLELGSKLGIVGEKGVRYNTGDEGLVDLERYMDIELKRGIIIPSKLFLGGRIVRISYTEQTPSCGNCLRPRIECEAGGFAAKCPQERPRANLTQITADFFEEIGFHGEPDLDEEGANEYDLAAEEISRVSTNTERTPLRERGVAVLGKVIDGIVINNVDEEIHRIMCDLVSSSRCRIDQ